MTIYGLMLAVSLRWFSWLAAGWLPILGSITYPIYLLHGLIDNWMLAYFDETNRYLGLFAVVSFMVFLSLFVSQVIEKRTVKLCRKPLIDQMNLAESLVGHLVGRINSKVKSSQQATNRGAKK